MNVRLAIQIDNDRKLMIIVNRSIDHPQVPAGTQYVRVETYSSEMVIRPHSTFDEVCCTRGTLTVNFARLMFTIDVVSMHGK